MNIVIFDIDEILAGPPPDLVIEFEAIILKLDLGTATQGDWSRFCEILTLATLEAGDAEAGQRGYLKGLEKWKACAAYDGSE